MKIGIHLRAGLAIGSMLLTTNVFAAADCALLGKLADQAYQSTANANHTRNYTVAYAYSRSFWNIVDAAQSQCSQITENASSLDKLALYTRDAGVPATSGEKVASITKPQTVNNGGNPSAADPLTHFCSPYQACKVTFPSHTTSTDQIVNRFQ